MAKLKSLYLIVRSEEDEIMEQIEIYVYERYFERFASWPMPCHEYPREFIILIGEA